MLIVPHISNVTSETRKQSVKIKLTLWADTGGNVVAALEQWDWKILQPPSEIKWNKLKVYKGAWLSR